MERFGCPNTEMIVIVCGAQMGKTESLMNVIGWRFDDGPRVPSLWIAPTQKSVKSVADDRVMKMIRHTPSLWSMLEKGRRNRVVEKYLAGVRLGFGWAGSATELASHPAGLVIVDELDRMIGDVDGEGDPLTLATARTKNYPLRKIGVCSTPTVEGASPIWSLWEDGTREKWAWPCKHCGTFFVPTLALLKWPDKADPMTARAKAFVVCPECGGVLTDRHKPRMNADGRFIAHAEQETGQELALAAPRPNSVSSFWISGLASPWQSFGEIAEKLVAAYRSKAPERIQSVVNTYGGEVWKISGDAPEWQSVMNSRAHYGRGSVPIGVRLITCGVDVQKDGLYWVIRGWGVNAESWLLDHGYLHGQTEYDQVWISLSGIILAPVMDRPIDRVFIDSGYRPGSIYHRPENAIYVFCRRHRSLAYPTKGHDTQDRPLKTADLDMSIGGRTVKGALKLWHINTDYAKTWIYAQIDAPADIGGEWHTHAQIDEDYARQMVAEEVITKSSGRRTWLEKGANHYLDCEVLAFGAALSLNVYALRAESSSPDQASPLVAAPRERVSGRFKRHG